jgi:putative salt-induced outer membrane protein YdiY
MPRSRSVSIAASAAGCLLALVTQTRAATTATNVVLGLSNGDRVAGMLLSSNTNGVLLDTPWAKGLFIPDAAITNRELVISTSPEVIQIDTVIAQASVPKPVLAQKSPARKVLKTDVKLGVDFQSGARDRSIYFGTMRLAWEKPYRQHSDRFFRTSLDYRADYGETDNEKSVNRMSGASKTDVPVSKRWYLYNLGVVGYDEFRKVNLGYEIGPGMGYHLLTRADFHVDVEAGLNYQFQDRSDGDDVESLYGRIAESIMWKISPKLTWTERFEFYPSLSSNDDFRLRIESTLSLGLSQHLSLNISVLDIFDTQPARGVDENEIMFRTALGVSF